MTLSPRVRVQHSGPTTVLLFFTRYLGCSVWLSGLCIAQRGPIEGPSDTGSPTCMLIPELCDGAEAGSLYPEAGHPVLIQIKVLHGLVAALLVPKM